MINPFTSRKKGRSGAGSGGDAGLAVAEREDFGAVYGRYVRPVYAFVAYRVRGRAEAEDVTSQVFEKALRGYVTYDPARAPLPSWLFTIARNCVTDHLRRAASRGEEVELDGELSSASCNDPEPALEAMELRLELREALAGLDEREREIVALKFGAAMSNRDIAAVMDISESNAGTILSRSLRKMKTRLEGGIDDD